MTIPERQRARGEMLPLMDVIFMLMVLFIFMLVQMRPDFGMSVELPEVREGRTAAPAPDDAGKRRIWVSVDSRNALFVDKEPVAGRAGVVAVVERLATGRPKEEVRIIFKGDRKADFGVVIEVFNELREGGYADVLFECEREKEGANENSDKMG